MTAAAWIAPAFSARAEENGILALLAPVHRQRNLFQGHLPARILDRAEVTSLSGRGVGMDVVNTHHRRLRGTSISPPTRVRARKSRCACR